MKKSVIVFLVLFTLLVSACGSIKGGATPRDTSALLKEVQSGTQGIELLVLPNLPPDQIYDLNELTTVVEIKNKGNHDLEPQECFLQVTGFDQRIISGDINAPRSCADGAGTLEGKNVYNIEGGFNQIEFSSTNVQLPDGVFEYNPTLNFLACYHYQTKASPSVCVDPQFYQVTAEQKTCIPQDVSLGGGQGAPVGISYVGVDMVGRKAIFEINIINQGVGRVLSPNTDVRNCAGSSLARTDLDQVAYVVDLSGGSPIDCKPRDGYVRLNNGQGKIICSFDINDNTAFQTPLMINLDYNYIQSFTKPIRIVKTPQ